MQIARLDHLVLTVADIAKTCDFYTKVLGMEVVRFGEGDKPTAGSGDLSFITETPIAEVVAHLTACGVPIITGPGPRAGAIGTITSVYIRDPDQNLVEISNY